MTLYRSCLRPLLFRLDPERVHDSTIALCEGLGRSAALTRAASRIYGYEDARLRSSVAGIAFANPVGLAAGFDKNGRAAAFLPALGFGAIEIGSVSAFP